MERITKSGKREFFTKVEYVKARTALRDLERVGWEVDRKEKVLQVAAKPLIG